MLSHPVTACANMPGCPPDFLGRLYALETPVDVIDAWAEAKSQKTVLVSMQNSSTTLND